MSGGIAIRDLVVDNQGRRGIVVSEECFPGQAWLRLQADARMMPFGRSDRWLGVMPLVGGMVVAPELLCLRIRAATPADVLEAVAGANTAGVASLLELFPDVGRSMAE